MANSERVTGPSNGLIPLIVVLLLCVATGGGIYLLHLKHYQDPTEAVSKDVLEAQDSQH